MHMRSGALGRCFGVPWPQHRSFRSLATSSSPPAPARRLRRSSARGQSAPEAPPPTRRVQVDVGDAVEAVEVPLVAPGSRVLTPEVTLPLGLTFEETDDGRLLVVEVAAGGNAERAGVRVGDLLRGTTAARTQMEYPTANLMFGGVGRPKLKKLLYPTTARPLATCLGAVRSNAALDGRACLVLERPSPAPSAEAEAAPVAAAAGPFDPRLFE